MNLDCHAMDADNQNLTKIHEIVYLDLPLQKRETKLHRSMIGYDDDCVVSYRRNNQAKHLKPSLECTLRLSSSVGG
jgi:hypothetical protein